MGTNNLKNLPFGVCYLNEAAAANPLMKTEGNAGIDCYATETVTLRKGDFALIPLGIVIKIPSGYFAALVPRSSTFKKWKVIQPNHFGVIDSSYCGPTDEVKFPVLATEDTTIEAGSKICQILVLQDTPVSVYSYDPVSEAAKNRGGFGSTGDSGNVN